MNETVRYGTSGPITNAKPIPTDHAADVERFALVIDGIREFARLYGVVGVVAEVNGFTKAGAQRAIDEGLVDTRRLGEYTKEN